MDKIVGFAKKIGMKEKLVRALELKAQGKVDELKQLFSRYTDYRAFAEFTCSPKKVFLSESYVIMVSDLDISGEIIVLGINDDGKLFLNFVTDVETPRPVEQLYCSDDEELYIYRTTDNLVWNALGYSYDLNICRSLLPDDWIRVQGDIRVFCEECPDPLLIFPMYISEQIISWLRLVIHRRIAGILESHELIPQIRENSIHLLGVKAIWDKEKIGRLVYRIAELVKDELYISDVYKVEDVVINKRGVTAYWVCYSDGKGWDVIIQVYYLPDASLSMYKRLVVSAFIDPIVRDTWAYRVVTECEKQIKGLIGQYVYTVGRHRITYTGYPYDITLVYEPPLVEKEPVLFTFRTVGLFTTDDKIVIEHPEHGTLKLKLPYKKCHVHIEPTRTIEGTSSGVWAIRNSYVFEHMLEQEV